MTAAVRCAHLATLDLELECEEGCPPPVAHGRWTVGATSEQVAQAVLDDLTNGLSVGGALLRLADRHPDPGPVFAADGDSSPLSPRATPTFTSATRPAECGR